MHQQLLFLTHLLNRLFASPVLALLHKLGIQPASPAAPIDNTLTLELVVMCVLLLFFIIVRATLNVERPGKAQQLAEIVHEFVHGQADSVIGHGYEPHLPFVTTILLFTLSCNLFGLLPGIPTPTATPAVPLGVAILTFLYYNFYGVRAKGPVGFVKHFMGPIWWISPLLFPIEIFSNCIRVMSLTIRLYANMFASDLLTLVFFSLIPIGVPVAFLGLHFGVAVIQSYVFMLLAMIYLSEAIAHEH
jgi:F-type H+-transporting ATPase subunit a